MENYSNMCADVRTMGVDRLKIVVFGSYNAGKSTFIRSIDPQSRHVEARSEDGSTTIALDYGRIRLNGTKVYLFGTPGQDRFDFARQILSRGMDGAIVIIDCSTATIDDMTYSLVEWLSTRDVPFAILLNKCDAEGSCPEMFSSGDQRGYVHTISALTGENVMDSLEAFVNRVIMQSTKTNSI
jgi:small GTP-binding protein